MIDLSRVRNYYVACGYTDLRRGIDGLAAIVMTRYGMERKRQTLYISDREPHVHGLLAPPSRNNSPTLTEPEPHLRSASGGDGAEALV